MRILYLIDSLGFGGAERSTALLQKPLRLLGAETVVAVLYESEAGYEATVRQSGTTVEVLRGNHDVARGNSFRRMIAEVEPSVIHTCLYRSDQIGRWAALGTGVPVVSSLVSTPRYIGRRWIGYPSRSKLLAATAVDLVGAHLRSTALHAVTEGVATEYRAHYRLPARKVRVVERGREADLVNLRTQSVRRTMREELGVPPDSPLVVSVGRIDALKQHHHLVEAAGHVLGAAPDTRFLIVGRDGDATARLDRALIDLGARASAVGRIGFREDATSIIAAADVTVIHSQAEGAAGVAIEALGVGTPVAAYPLAGLRGVLVHEINSLVASRPQPTSLAEQVIRLLGDPALAARIAKRGQSDFIERFELQASAARLLEFYREVVARRGSARQRPQRPAGAKRGSAR